MKKTFNAIELGMLVITGVGMLGTFWVYCEDHFAHADAVKEEIDARKELKAEIDALYMKLIPDRERVPLHHPMKED